MRKKINYFVIAYIVLLFGGCIFEKENETVNSGRIVILKNNGVSEVYSKDEIMGIEISVTGKIDESKIETDDTKMKIVYYDGEKTNIAIAAKGGKISPNEKILSFEGIEIEKAEVLNFVKSITVKSEEESVKETQLLGDYNEDGTVEINDFYLFSQNYGKDGNEFDISPALKGVGDSSEIYSKNYGDGKVTLEDLVVFAFNFGKERPIDEIKIKTTKSAINIGENLQMDYICYKDGIEKNIETVWSLESEESYIKIESIGKVTGISHGTAKIKVTAFGISEYFDITVNDSLDGEYYSDGSFVTYFKNQSDESKAINVIVMGDGYIKEDLGKDGSYETEAKKIIDGMFKTAPFSQYKQYFNAYIIFCESKERGADYTQSEDNLDTVFNANYGQNGIDRLLVIKNYSKVSEYINNAGLASKNGLKKNIMIISVNDTKYGGSGGTYSVISKNEYAVEIAKHEIGHSFGGLADEYTYGATYPKANAAYQKNVDLTYDIAKIKWNYFVGVSGYEDVGAYEGGYYYETGVWRPTSNCLMKTLGIPFCPICREAIVKVIHSCVQKEYLFSEFIEEDKVNLSAIPENKSLNSYPEMFPDDLRALNME